MQSNSAGIGGVEKIAESMDFSEPRDNSSEGVSEDFSGEPKEKHKKGHNIRSTFKKPLKKSAKFLKPRGFGKHEHSKNAELTENPIKHEVELEPLLARDLMEPNDETKTPRKNIEPEFQANRINVIYGREIPKDKQSRLFAGYTRQEMEFRANANSDQKSLASTSKRPVWSWWHDDVTKQDGYKPSFTFGKEHKWDTENKAEIAMQFATDIQEYQNRSIHFSQIMDAIIDSLTNAGVTKPPWYLQDPNIMIVTGKVRNLNEVHEFCNDYFDFMELIKANDASDIGAQNIKQVRITKKESCAGCDKTLDIGGMARTMDKCDHHYHSHCIVGPYRIMGECPACKNKKTNDFITKTFSSPALKKESKNYKQFKSLAAKSFKQR